MQRITNGSWIMPIDSTEDEVDERDDAVYERDVEDIAASQTLTERYLRENGVAFG
jgi:hypothetical protein